MKYVDGFVLAVKTDQLDTYKEMAQQGGDVWMKHGALQYVEAIADDLDSTQEWGGFPFKKTLDVKDDETLIFSFITYRSREHRDEVNAKVMADPEMSEEKFKDKAMPFEMNRMATGGFQSFVDVSS